MTEHAESIAGDEPHPLRPTWFTPDSTSRRRALAFLIYVICLAVFAILAGDRLFTHTPYNHFAHLANAWLHGRHDLAGGAPAYAGNNDFAVFEGKTHISFPPFPGALMLPWVALAGSPENFRDAQFVVWLAGIGPAVLFLVFEKLRRSNRSRHTERENVWLALLFAFGTVYFFTAVQGTVWFAAHVVGVGLMALFVLFALDAERPALAGLLLGCLFLTRVTTVLVGVFFLFEVARKASKRAPRGEVFRAIDGRALLATSVSFAIPCFCAVALASWLNFVRYHTRLPWAFGHEFLTVGWQGRIQRWGLFSYHFLPRNLGIMTAGLPWSRMGGEGNVHRFPFTIGGHGLALWFTSPIYFWLIRPLRRNLLAWAAFFSALGPLLVNLFYQNSGWFQFGYRFSNDYAIFLFVMLAVSVRRFGRVFWFAAVWSVAWNLVGAITFERAAYADLYSHDPNAYFPAE